MTDFSGSYRRFGANDSFPSSREHNRALGDYLNNAVHLNRHKRNLRARPENKNEEAHQEFLSTDYGREENKGVDNAFYGSEYQIKRGGGSLVGGSSFHKGSASKTHRGDLDFTTKRGDKDFHRGGHDEHSALGGGALYHHEHDKIGSFKVPHKHQGSMTRRGRLDFVTHRGDKDFHRGGHDEHSALRGGAMRRRNHNLDGAGRLKGGDFDPADLLPILLAPFGV